MRFSQHFLSGGARALFDHQGVFAIILGMEPLAVLEN